MRLFDAHCDVISVYSLPGDFSACHFKPEQAMEYPAFIQIFAAWVTGDSPRATAHTLIDKFNHMVKAYNMRQILCGEDMDKAQLGALLSIEDGAALEGDIGAVEEFYNRGVRAMGLTWNGTNELASGCLAPRDSGLTVLGRQVIDEMNRLGMVIDLSHISQKGFWDVLEYTSAPVMASHSNANEVCPFPRNLTDAQFQAISQRGGVVGINLCPDFLSSEGDAGLTHILRHIEHFAALGGMENIGFGADFDGIDSLPEGCDGVRIYSKIIDKLLMLGYSEKNVKGIASENFCNFIKNVLHFSDL